MEIFLSDPISAECPCGPDLEYDPEYLLLFTRAAPREEAQYGDFVSTPENINWAELERDARRMRWHQNRYASNWQTWKRAAHCRWMPFARQQRPLSGCNAMRVKR